nr:unnamed protein product [Callosobruchus analis]
MQLLACLVLLIGIVNARKLPTYIQVCHRDDPNVAECLVKNVEALRPKFSQGIPEMSIPSMNPLEIPAASLNTGGNFKADFANLKIYGADKFQMKKVYLILKDKPHFELDLYFDNLRVIADYKMDGKILVLKLNGHGRMDANFTDVTAHSSTDGKHYEKNGKTHLTFVNPEVSDLVVKKAHFQFDNIFGDNEQLNVQTNQVLNDSAEELIKELSPVITSVARDIVYGIFSVRFSAKNEVPLHRSFPSHRSQLQKATCLQRNAEIIRPRLKKGIPEMHIPSFNPLVISQATLNGGMYGADNFILDKFEVSMKEKFRFDIEIHFDRLRIMSDYKINGRLLVLQLNGEGPADGNYSKSFTIGYFTMLILSRAVQKFLLSRYLNLIKDCCKKFTLNIQ